jgi:adenylosuccinate synthase
VIFLTGKGIVVVGCQFGDEGKGKIVDFYCSKPYINAVVRFNGGSNAGHTIVAENKKYALHLLPSGMIYGKTSLMGNGMVVNPRKLDEELKMFPKKVENLKIDPKSHLVLPLHIQLDAHQEQVKKQGNIAAGTTKQGVGPCYADKASRIYDHLKDTLQIPSLNEQKEELLSYYDKYRKNFTDVGEYVENLILSDHNVLFEGAQATLLDIDHGVYPFSTSSTCLVSGASSGTGIGIKYLNERIGVVKAYTSRVGEGPFISELNASENPGKYIQQTGAEFGTTTGRPRRIGWLDLVSIKYSARLNSLTGLAITKLDIIGGLDVFKVVTKYLTHTGEETTSLPPSVMQIKNFKPIFKEFKGWGTFSKEEYSNICNRKVSEIPSLIKEFISFIETYLKVPVYIASFGPDRELTLELNNLETQL